MFKLFVGAIVGGLLVGGLAVVGEPCKYEDGPAPCFWDAQDRGNGIGDSFVMLTDSWTVTLPF